LLERDLHKVAPGEAIGIGTATDPYQPLERRLELTRSLWEVFARWRGLRLGLVTKSALVTRDVELLQRVAARHDLTIHLTITTDDVGLARKLEPRAPRPDLRFETVKTLREAGLRAGVLCIPAMPGVNDSAKQLERMVKKAAAVKASFFSTGALFLKPCSKPVFMAFIAEHFPHLQGDYERRFARSAFLAGDYAREISRRVAMLCIEHGVSLRREATTDITTTPLGEVATIMEAIPAQKQTALPLRGFVPVSDLRRRAG
jgi:DNA repair photolyase